MITVSTFIFIFFASLEDTIVINDWDYLGPFPIGVREGIIGIDLDLTDENFTPDNNVSYPSFLVQGGFVKWKELNTKDEKIEIKYKDVLWDTLQNYYGIAGLVCASICYGDFESEKEVQALIDAQRIGSFILNGRTYPADPYGDGFLIPVVLEKGKNRVILKPSGFGEHSFSFRIITNPQALMIIRNITHPDFIEGEIYDGYAGIPIMNTTERVIKNIKIELSGDIIERTEKEISRIMPLSAIKIPVHLKSKGRIGKGDSSLIKIRVYNNDYKTQDSFWIKIKKSNEPYAKTFISKIDNSCQYYAVLPPKNFSSDSFYALIMSCHGAGVEALNQVRSYSQKDWAYVVAPTNRRRYGFDWQDWGEIDFLEVLEDVKKNFRININRIYLTGHSMGGHGVWHIGLSHPDLFAAIAPSAGWISFPLYIPWFLQRSEIFSEPDQIKFRDMVLRKDNTPLFLMNALNLPIYILHGGADDNVPPIQGRMMAQYLNELKYDFVYNEVEGTGHWWDIDSTPGADCVDLKEMMDFLKEKVRNPYPHKIIFKTTDINHSNKAYWIRIDELEDIYQDGVVIAEADTTGKIESFLEPWHYYIQYTVQTKNVREFTIQIKETKLKPDYIFFKIDNTEIKWVKYKGEKEFSFRKSGESFKITKNREKFCQKTFNLYGPIKQAYFSPFILIYGTIGDSSDTEYNLRQARLQSYIWWIKANGYTEIVPDTEVTEEHIKNFNLILFGNSETNALIKRINNRLPINFKNDYKSIGRMIQNIGPNEVCISLNKNILRYRDLCLMEIYPNPLNSEKFVLLYSATTKKAQKYLNLFPVIYSGSGLPDFVIWDESANKYGWAGVVAAGFFDKRWKIDNNLIYIVSLDFL
uniref:Peptidase S9 prolyl oligopeptidase catalytic domain-containing protein n=1 Tax=candidate division WOR-3 bacterium TaxID=2052148 RepID=A0A7V1EI43_UNCW3